MISESPKRRKILYVCPLAHRGGHRPHAIVTETKALSMAGFDPTLLTFDGVEGEKEVPRIQHLTILSQDKISSLVRFSTKILNHSTLTQYVAVLFEMFSSLLKAVFVKKKGEYDIIHLREGDPFPFLVLLLNFFLKGYKWVVTILVLDPSMGIIRKINYNKLWKPFYYCSLVKNRFVYLCLTESLKLEYEKLMNGLFANRVIYLPPFTECVENTFPKEKARECLGLPKDKIMLLAFGSFHLGKNTSIIVRALQDLPNVYLVLAGSFEREVDIERSSRAHLIIRNYYIPEEEKLLYFSAADAVVLSYRRNFLKTACPSMLWEACKLGKPVIASDGGQLGELVKAFQLGLLFETENEFSLRKAILRFLNLGQNELKVLNTNCKRFCSEFSSKKWCKRYIDECLRALSW